MTRESSLRDPDPSTDSASDLLKRLRESINNRRALQKLAQSLSRPPSPTIGRKSPNLVNPQLVAFLELRRERGDFDDEGSDEEGKPDPPTGRHSLWDAYQEALLAISSLSPSFLGLIMRSLAERLLPALHSDSGKVRIRSGKMIKQIVQTVQSLVKQCPSSATYLMPSIEFFFPFHGRPYEDHVCFVQGLLTLADTLPTWRYRVLELIIGKALIIDIELQNDVILLQSIDSDPTVGDLELEENIPEGGDAETDEQRAESEARKKLRRVKEGCRKLDKILDLLFQHTKQYTALSEDRTREMFNFLLSVFERSILPTFKSRHLQFLPFYLTSQMSTSADQFLGLLFQPLVQFCRGVDAGRRAVPNPKLLLSVAYIGSYVARAGSLSPHLVQVAFQMLLDLVSRLLTQSRIGSPPVLTVIALQHILYIFRWRWSELLELVEEEDLADDFALVLGDGDILQYCSPAIVEPFMEAAGKMLGLLPEKVMDQWRTGWNTAPQTLAKYAEMSAYFPFDPPLGLPALKALISEANVYRFDLLPIELTNEGDIDDRDSDKGRDGGGEPSTRESSEKDPQTSEEAEFHSDSSRPSL